MIKTTANWKSCWDSFFFFMARMNFQSQPRSGMLCESCIRQTCKLGFLSRAPSLIGLFRWRSFTFLRFVAEQTFFWFSCWTESQKTENSEWSSVSKKRLLVFSCLILGVVIKCFCQKIVKEMRYSKLDHSDWSSFYHTCTCVHLYLVMNYANHFGLEKPSTSNLRTSRQLIV